MRALRICDCLAPGAAGRLASLGVAAFLAAASGLAPAVADPVKPPLPEKAPKEPAAAKDLFGAENRPANLASRSIGFYSKGCLAGAKELPIDGPNWQAMRLSRNRNWGHPRLIRLVEKLARDAAEKDGWPGLLVGDLAQPRGGPMTSGHASHQVGLDVDVWLNPMPDRRYSYEEREKVSAVSMLKDTLSVDPNIFTPEHVKLIKRAASYREVDRVGVNPAIKLALCRAEGGDKPWLKKVQMWPGHHYHMHIRIKCPPDSAGCKGQSPPTNTSCAAAEKWYRDTKAYLERPKKPKPPEVAKREKPEKPKRQVMLSELPKACRAVLAAAPAGTPPLRDIVTPSRKPDNRADASGAAAAAPAARPQAAPSHQ